MALTNFLHHKKSYAVLNSVLHTYAECSGPKLAKDKKEKPIALIGSCHDNQEAFDIPKMNEPIKMFGRYLLYL